MLITSPRKKVDVRVSACDIEQKSYTWASEFPYFLLLTQVLEH